MVRQGDIGLWVGADPDQAVVALWALAENPEQALHGVRLSKHSPLMTAGYRRTRPWKSLRLRQRLSTRLARLKGLVKDQLKSQGPTTP